MSKFEISRATGSQIGHGSSGPGNSPSTYLRKCELVEEIIIIKSMKGSMPDTSLCNRTH